MQGELLLNVVHIAGMSMTESLIDRLLRENNMGGVMRSLNPLQFVLLYQVVVMTSGGLEPCLR